MSIKIGNTDIIDVKIGDSSISSIYAGTNLIWIKSCFTVYSTTGQGIIYWVNDSQKYVSDTDFKLQSDGTYKATKPLKEATSIANFLLNKDLYKVELSKADLSKCTNISSALQQAGLTELGDIEELDLSNAIIANNFISQNPVTGSINVTKWNPINATTIASMFFLSKFEDIRCNNWSFNNPVDVYGLCAYSYNLKTVDFTGSDFTNATNASYFFANNTLLEEVKGTLNFPNVTNMSYFAIYCAALKGINITNISNNCTNMVNMFSNCTNIETIDVSTWDTSRVTDFTGAFYNTKISSIGALDISSTSSIGGLFGYCRRLTSIDTSKWKNVTINNAANAFTNCSVLSSVDLSGLTLNNCNCQNLFNGCSQLTSFGSLKGSISNAANMFNNCSNLENVDLDNIDLSNCTNMSSMFYNVSNTCNIIGFENIQTDNCTSFAYMFFHHRLTLTQLKSIENWKTDKLTAINNMFQGCNHNFGNYTLDLSGWNFDNVLNADNAFMDWGNGVLDLSSWDTTKMTNVSAISYGNTQGRFIISPKFFNNNASTINLLKNYRCSISREVDIAYRNLLESLRDNPKVNDDNWDGQIVRLEIEPLNYMKTNLTSLFDEVQELGWTLTN